MSDEFLLGVRIIEPEHCPGGAVCPGSPESIKARKIKNAGIEGPILGGSICHDACHKDPPGPCSGSGFKVPPIPGRKSFEEFTREFLERLEPDSLDFKPLGPGDKLPDTTLGPRPDRLKPRIPSPFSPHPIESPPPVPNHLVGPDDGMSTEDRNSPI